jgi:hypothetical protein
LSDLGFVYERDIADWQWKPRRITKVTAKKVFYESPGYRRDRWVCRADMERFFCAEPLGKCRWSSWRHPGESEVRNFLGVAALPEGRQAKILDYIMVMLAREERKREDYSSMSWERLARYGRASFAHSTIDASVLGLSGDFSRDDVERAFRAKAKLTHPDRGGDSAAFQKLAAARDRLLSACQA